MAAERASDAPGRQRPLWRDGADRLVGFAAWQVNWAALDLWVPRIPPPRDWDRLARDHER